MHKITFYHLGGSVCIDQVPTEEARRVAAAFKNPDCVGLQLDSRAKGSNSTTLVNTRLVTTVTIEPPLPADEQF